MASLVVGLFEHRSDAEAAITDLVNNNYDREHIDLKEPYTEDSQNSLASVRHELEGEGVPEGDAKLFEEGMRSGDALAVAHTDDDRAELAREIMNRHGALDIHDAYAQRGAAVPFVAPVAAPVTPARIENADEIVVPVVAEELAVGKREIQRGGVRVFQRVSERPVEESVTLREEQVTVDRRPVDRAVTSADAAFAETADVVVTKTAEVPVVSKEARVVEEVVVGKTETERVETVHDTVRSTEVKIDDVSDNTLGRN